MPEKTWNAYLMFWTKHVVFIHKYQLLREWEKSVSILDFHYKCIKCQIQLTKQENFILVKNQTIWTYGIKLWESASRPNFLKIQRSPKYILNWLIYKNGNISTVNDKMRTHSDKYKAASKIIIARKLCPKTTRAKLKREFILLLITENVNIILLLSGYLYKL